MVRRVVLTVALLFVAAGCMFAQNGAAGKFAGYWNGVLSVGGQQIKMEFGIMEKGESIEGTMAAQGQKGIPVDVTVKGDSLSLKVKPLNMTYAGVKFGANVMGTFSQNGFTTAMMLFPGKIQRNRPQAPKAPYPYVTEEVTFTNGAEGSQLSGTVTYPVGYENMKPRKVPVVVMVTGSGLQNRDEEVFDHKPFAVIADWLARNGIASLRYDDRGTGKSAGPLENATSKNYAADAKAAVEYVRGLKKFGKVGVLGHSEGGTIALMLAGEGIPDYIISMAGVATKGVECIVWQNVALLEQQGVPEQMRSDYGKALRGIYAQRVKNGGPVADAQKFVQQMCSSEGLKLPPQFIANLVAVASLESPWIDFFVAYDPAEAVGKIKCPVMAVNGTLDMQVPAENLQVLGRLLPPNGKNMIKEYPGKNHLFQNCTKGNSLQYEEIEETISQDVLQDISNWIKEL